MDTILATTLPTLRNTASEISKPPSVWKAVRRHLIFLFTLIVEVWLLIQFRNPISWYFYYPYIYPFVRPYIPYISPYLNLRGFMLFVLTIPFILYEIVLIHEFGHFLAGRLLHFRFQSYVAGPLRIERKRKKIRVRMVKTLNILSGCVRSTPSDVKHFRRREIIVYASGPLANFVQGSILTLCSFLVDSNTYPLVVFVLRLTVFFAFVDFMAIFIPHRLSNGLLSDAAAILVLLKGGLPVERWRARTAMYIRMMEGQLPREWDAGPVEKAMSLPDGSQEDAWGCWYGYNRALDTGDIDRARQTLERMLDAHQKLTLNHRKYLALEAAYFEARYHQNPAAARVWLEQTKGVKELRCTRLRVRAAVYLAEGHAEKARSCIRWGMAVTKFALLPGTERFEKALLQDLKDQIEREFQTRMGWDNTSKALSGDPIPGDKQESVEHKEGN